MTLSRFIPAFLVALLAFAQPAGAQGFKPSFEQGLAAFNYGDNEMAGRHFWRLAGQGDARAQYYLAYMLDTGLGMGKDVVGASRWYKKSADQDYLPAIVYMGYIYSTGHGMPRNDKEAFVWYVKAAQMGDAIAQNNLATMLRAGRPYKQDMKLAGQWFLQSAMQGNTRAQYNLATMYRLGEGVPKSFPEALKWYTFAANQGDMFAQNALGYMYRHGYGVEKDYGQSIDWYRRAAEQGHLRSQISIANMYEMGVAGKTINDAAIWYLNAAKQNSGYAQYRVAKMYETGLGLPKDGAEAVRWYKKAIEENEYPGAYVSLGDLYLNGVNGVSRNPVRAIEMYFIAADMGYVPGMLRLARIHREGAKGVPVDLIKAYQWYALSEAELMGSNSKNTDLRAEALEGRIQLSSTMPLQDIDRAKRYVETWRPKSEREKPRNPNEKKPQFEYE